MYILLNILILLIILFLYIHINYYLTTSNYLEIYEIDFKSKEKFEELCNLKQPLLIKNFIFNEDELLENFKLENIVSNYGNFDIKLYNKENNSIPIFLDFLKASTVFKNDNSSNYISENNNDFLIESSLIKNLQNIDILLRPYGISKINYDIIMGSANSYTNFNISGFHNLVVKFLPLVCCGIPFFFNKILIFFFIIIGNFLLNSLVTLHAFS